MQKQRGKGLVKLTWQIGFWPNWLFDVILYSLAGQPLRKDRLFGGATVFSEGLARETMIL